MIIYNETKGEVGRVKGLHGTMVSIDSISVERFDLTNSGDDCGLHNFIKVKSSKVNGWLYGKDVYEYVKDRDTSFTINEEYFKISPIKNFDIGASDDAGLTFCSDHNPVIVYNSKHDMSELIPVVDKIGKYHSDYLVMEENDMCLDKIKNAVLEDENLKLTIYREYQEGAADFTIVIHFQKNGSTAEVISVKDYELGE